MPRARALLPALALACIAGPSPSLSQALGEISIRDASRAPGVLSVRVQRPLEWKPVVPDDPQALAELRGPLDGLGGTLQIGRGARVHDIAALCAPHRAPTMLRAVESAEPGTRVTEVRATTHQGRPAFAVGYERRAAAEYTRVHSLIVCLQDSRLLVSCAGTGASKAALSRVDPVCRQVLESLQVTEE
jgi:hypothetical protein